MRQLSLAELHQLKWLLGAMLVLLSLWTVFYLEIDAWALMSLATCGVLLALARPAWPGRVPPWVHRLVFPTVVAFFICDLWVTGEVLPAIVRLDILLLFYRGTSYRKKRDDLQVVVLGLFLIVVAGVLTVSLWFAAQILVFTGCALVFLLLVTLVEATEKSASVDAVGPPQPNWIDVNWWHLLTRVRTVMDWRVAGLAVGLFVGVVGVSAMLFLAIPRFQLENSLFLERFVSKKARSGFNETIRFGEVTEIQQDTSVAVSVDVTDRAQIPATPYWRMLVLDEYRDGSFRLSAPLRRSGFSLERTDAMVRGPVRSQLGEAVFWTFYLEAGISRYLPLLGAFEQLRFREMQNFRLGSDLGLVALRDEPVTMTAYRVEGMKTGDTVADPAFASLIAGGKEGGALRSPALMLRLGVTEPDRGRLQQMVREITGGAVLTAPEFSYRTSKWLGRRHAYSLQPVIPEGSGDPLVRWMGANGGGHCELFAGAFVLLARSAGFPTRVVTGFKGGTWNAYSNNFTLRNSDAHAWCEIWDRAAGAWRRADPTADAAGTPPDEGRGEGALARRTDRSWTARFDSLRVFWYRRIVNFDQRSQVETLRAVKEATENSGRQLRGKLAELAEWLKAWLAAPWDGRRVARLLAWVVAGVGAGWLWRQFGWAWWRQLAGKRGGRPLDPVRQEARKWLRKLTTGGAMTENRSVVADLQRLRYGARETWPIPAGVFRAARKTLRDARRYRAVTPV